MLLVKEPNNPHDPGAVAVQTLLGEQLGYVPRSHTARFAHDVTLASVVSTGQSGDTGLWGCYVRACPGLASCDFVDVLPRSAVPPGSKRPGEAMDPAAVVGAAAWQAASRSALQRSRHCQVTGVPASKAQLLVVPEWRLDADSKTFRLLQGVTVCEEVFYAKQYGLAAGSGHSSDGTLQKRLRETVCLLHAWRGKDFDAYLAFMAQRQAQLDADPAWKLAV